MAVVNFAHNRTLVDDRWTRSSPLSLDVGTGGGKLILQLKNTGSVGVFARLSSSPDQTDWARVRPQTEGMLTLDTSAATSLELYRSSEPRFINIHSERSPDQVFGSVELTRHA